LDWLSDFLHFRCSFGHSAENPGTGNGYGYNSESNGNTYGPASLTIPIFTVTVNPLEADEMTFVPDSPTDFPKPSLGRRSQAEIANMTIIVDDADRMLNDGYDSGDEASRNRFDETPFWDQKSF
jgi:hypothetical protein